MENSKLYCLLVISILIIIVAACRKNHSTIDEGNDNNSSLPTNLPSDLRLPVINVKKSGAVGDGQTDDTRAFQQAIDQLDAIGGGTVYVPPGNYAIDAKRSVQLKSKVDIYMPDTLTQLMAIPNDSANYCVLMVSDALDVHIRGGKIVGERSKHTGTKGEWGMGVGIYGSGGVVLSDMVITDCWGDGIYISDNKSKTHGSAYIWIKNVISRNNRRQGMSIIKASIIKVENCKFLYTNGTAPQAGIDIEPNYDTASHITIINTECAYNNGSGIQTYELKSPKQTVITNLEIHDNYLHHNNAYGGRISGGRNINFTNNRIVENKLSPMVYARDTVNCVLWPNLSN